MPMGKPLRGEDNVQIIEDLQTKVHVFKNLQVRLQFLISYICQKKQFSADFLKMQHSPTICGRCFTFKPRIQIL